MKRESRKIGILELSHRTLFSMSTSLSFHNLRSSSRVVVEVRCMVGIVWFHIAGPKIKYLPTSRLLLMATSFIRSPTRIINIVMKKCLRKPKVHLLLKQRWSMPCSSILSIRVWTNAKTMKIKWWRLLASSTHSCCTLQRMTWYLVFRFFNSPMVRMVVLAPLMALEASRAWHHQYFKSWEISTVWDTKKLKELSCCRRPLKRSRMLPMCTFHA